MINLAEEFKTRLVSGVLLQSDRVLLGLRKNTNYFPEYWSLPVGHVEQGESDFRALRREFFEEIGIQILEAIPFCVKIDQQDSIYHQVFILVDYSGEIKNREPDLCSELKWFSLECLPKNLTPISREILTDVNAKE